MIHALSILGLAVVALVAVVAFTLTSAWLLVGPYLKKGRRA